MHGQQPQDENGTELEAAASVGPGPKMFLAKKLLTLQHRGRKPAQSNGAVSDPLCAQHGGDATAKVPEAAKAPNPRIACPIRSLHRRRQRSHEQRGRRINGHAG